MKKMGIPINGINSITTIYSSLINKICIYIVSHKYRYVNKTEKFFPDDFMQISCFDSINMIIKPFVGEFYDR